MYLLIFTYECKIWHCEIVMEMIRIKTGKRRNIGAPSLDMPGFIENEK